MQYFNQRENVNVDEIEEIAKGIVLGRNVIFPTETVYGIGTNALDKVACEKIFHIKGRPKNKPLIVLISDLDMLNQIVQDVNELERKLMDAFWPGPLTIILNKNQESNIPDVVTAGKNKIGVRMTSGEIAKMLIQKAGVPIVAPSANLSGRTTGTKIGEIIYDLGEKVDYVIDCGDLKTQEVSTIVEVKENKIHILREGKITKRQLEEIGEVKII